MLNASDTAYLDKLSENTSVPLFALDCSDEHFAATIQSGNGQTVQLKTRSRLQPGRRLVMKYEGCRTELEVSSCRGEDSDSCILDCRVISARKGAVRNDWRMPVNWPAWVRIPPAKEKHRACIKDMSVFGLGLELGFAPDPDSLLIVSMQSGTGFGRVKHCRRTSDHQYFVGLYLDEFVSETAYEFQWATLPGNVLRLLSKAVCSVARLCWTERASAKP